jgi:hypothetical protein
MLDNLEHALEAAPALGNLLAAPPELERLVTSGGGNGPEAR